MATPPAHFVQEHWYSRAWHPGHWVGEPVAAVPAGTQYDSIYWRILQAVQAKCQALDLPYLEPEHVYLRKIPRKEQTDEVPAIWIFPAGDEYPNQGSSARDWVTYRVGLVWCVSGKENQRDFFDATLAWRERIADNFRHQRLPGVAENYTCTIATGGVFAQSKFFGEGLDVSALTLVFKAVQARSYTALV